jgi:hypothetical protein
VAELLLASMVDGKRRGRRVAGMVLDFLVEFDWEVEEEVEEEVALDELVVGRGRRRDIVWWWWWWVRGCSTIKRGVWTRGYWYDGGCGVGRAWASLLLYCCDDGCQYRV